MRKVAFLLSLVVLLLLPGLSPSLEVQAAVLNINPNEGCVETNVAITGSGWPEPQPVCHYRFLFDHPNPGDLKEDIAPRQPDGLFGPPNSSFTVPADSVPGPHKVQVQLFLNSGELIQQEEQPFTVIGVEYEFDGKTDCNIIDSGFDATGVEGPPWLSVAVGQTTKSAGAKAIIKPAGNATDVRFKSSDPGKATVQPTQASTSPQELQVTGVAAGEIINIMGARVEDRDPICEPLNGKNLNVAVYKNQTVQVAAFIITPKKRPGHPAGGCLKPNPNTSKSKLQKALNKIWDQAAIAFTVTKFQKKTVDFDLDDDCVLDAGTPTALGPEETAIVNAAKDLNADINVYYVQDYSIDNASTLNRLTFIQDSHANTTENITAHEIGHSLDLADVADVTRLMLESSSANNPCFLNKTEWDPSNAKAGTFP